jgi:hypothetical protein
MSAISFGSKPLGWVGKRARDRMATKRSFTAVSILIDFLRFSGGTRFIVGGKRTPSPGSYLTDLSRKER